ncbi:hypothetical protein FIV04_13785 [Vibrio sp. THAF190c]|nr:hypothetical protein FIV04_13785 [Vibrio sp. THAF190c]
MATFLFYRENTIESFISFLGYFVHVFYFMLII